jgi:vacuolar-type H+-ATPase subunit E/Vma4
MLITDLLRAIEDEAASERAAAERASALEAAAVVARARERATEVEAEQAAAALRPARAEAERELALARLAAAGTIRAAREEAFASVLADIRTRLGSVRDSDTYPQRLRALVNESRAALPAARELRVDPRDVELARSIAGELSVVATLDTAGGVELVGDDGRTVRNTFEERLANAEPLLRRRFARWLGPSESPSSSSSSSLSGSSDP